MAMLTAVAWTGIHVYLAKREPTVVNELSAASRAGMIDSRDIEGQPCGSREEINGPDDEARHEVPPTPSLILIPGLFPFP